MQLGEAFTFRDQIAPRVGAAWDFFGGGRSRLHASFGRSYAALPAGMGDDVVARPATRRELDGDLIFDPGAVLPVAAAADPIVVEELAAGVEAIYPRTGRGLFRLAAWSQLVWQRRGLETVRGVLTAPDDPPATRGATIVAGELSTVPGGALDVRVQWQWSHVTGAAPGAFDPREGAILHAGTAYDTAVDGANLVGPLPSDLRGRVAIEGVARGRLGPVPVVVGLRAGISAGRPIDALARTADGTVHLLPRGAGGRLGRITGTNLHAAARLGRRVELVADLFNLFHRQGATAVDEVYTEDDVVPIDRGASEDLVFLKTTAGNGAVRSPSYGRPTSRQAPFAAAIGVRGTF